VDVLLHIEPEPDLNVSSGVMECGADLEEVPRRLFARATSICDEENN